MLESAFTAAITTVLRRQGAMVQIIQAGIYTSPGWPDRLVVSTSWTGMVESKGAFTPVEPLQERVMQDLNKRHRKFAVLVRHVPGEAILETSREVSREVSRIARILCSVSYMSPQGEWEWVTERCELRDLLTVLLDWSKR